MPLLRRFALLAVVAVGFAVLSSPTFAAPIRDDALPFHLDSVNFRVHYQSANPPASAYPITQTQAGDIAALAERALAAETADGYPRPLDDGGAGGDGRIDIYVEDFSDAPGVLGDAVWDNNAPTTSGYIELAGNDPLRAFTQHNLAHEVFHLIQFNMWLPSSLWVSPTSLSDAWLYEASAEWMAFRVDGYPPPGALGPPDMSLDCRDPIGTNMCDLRDDYRNNGYSRWTFFEYLSEKYGAGFLKDIFALGLVGAPATATTAISAVKQALIAKGTTLDAAYNAWTLAETTSSYSAAPALQAVGPQPYNAEPIFTGTATTTDANPVTSQKVAVNHLSTRFLEFERGPTVGGTTGAVCWSATLAVSVTIPTGTLSQPIFYWNGPGSSAVPLSINGSNATASIPWDTCTWATGEGFLSLPNASQNVDAADFKVIVSLSITLPLHQVTSIVPSLPPPPVVVTSPVVSVSSLDVAPTITVFGPELLKLSATDSQIRLIVSASGEGLVSARLGSLALGTANLRAGNNDLRFTVPKGVLATVRRSAVASNVLTLTPTSANGAAAGTPVTRTISVTPAKKTPAKKVPAKKTPAKKTKHAK